MDNSNYTGPSEPLGRGAVDSLRAEDEWWLDRCYEQPRDMDLMAGSRSIVVFGKRGSGKTGLYRALSRRCFTADGQPARLLVDWRPTPPEGGDANSATIRSQISQIFDACVVALLRQLAAKPGLFEAAPAWAQETLRWFVHRYGEGNLLVRLGPMVEEYPAGGIDLLRAILDTTPSEVLSRHAPQEQVASRLVEALNRIGLTGVWVMADGLETWAEAEPEELRALLVALLSTLPLFERAQFTYKLMLPSTLETPLLQSAAVSRRRVDGYRLDWEAKALQRIVERRLAFAIGRAAFKLDNLCAGADQLLAWLERAGGDCPREWLDQMRPLLSRYLDEGGKRPLAVDAWKEIMRHHPPRLYIDPEGQHVLVGGRLVSVEELPPKGVEMLAYLYERSGRPVSKSELYYRAIRGLDHVPRAVGDSFYESPKSYEGLMDTNLWRLRQIIEPDPKHPVLLVTVRGRGIKLENRW